MHHRLLRLLATPILPILLSAGLATAADYPLGTMTCDDIGTFASEVMAAKKEGRSLDDALASLETRSYGDPVEKKNLVDVVNILYGNLGRNLGVKVAGAVMKQDCETGRPAK